MCVNDAEGEMPHDAVSGGLKNKLYLVQTFLKDQVKRITKSLKWLCFFNICRYLCRRRGLGLNTGIVVKLAVNAKWLYLSNQLLILQLTALLHQLFSEKASNAVVINCYTSTRCNCNFRCLEDWALQLDAQNNGFPQLTKVVIRRNQVKVLYEKLFIVFPVFKRLEQY